MTSDDSELIDRFEDGSELRRREAEDASLDDDKDQLFLRYADGTEADVYSAVKIRDVWSITLRSDV